MTSRLTARIREAVPSSSRSIMDEKPTTSAARIAASRRVVTRRLLKGHNRSSLIPLRSHADFFSYPASANVCECSLITLPSALSTTCGTCHSLLVGITPQRLVTPAIQSGL